MTHAVGLSGKIPQWTVADRVRKARESARLKQNDLSKLLGMARTSLARIEQGKSDPRRTTLIGIAFATNVDLTWLETGETPGGDMPTGGEECAIRESNPEPTDLRLVA